MKIIEAGVMVTLMLAAGAAGAQGMSEADMQRMMQQAEKMQACMQQVDQAAMQAMQAEAEAKTAEIDGLCRAGKRDAAQKTAMQYGLEMAKDPNVARMRECSKMMQAAMANMPQMPRAAMPDVEELKSRHVCD